MGKVGRLADGSHYGDGTRIIRSRIGARAAASPSAETITGGWRCADRESRATGSPTAPGTYMAACPSAHGHVELGAKFGGVRRSACRRDRMGDRAAVTPTAKIVAHARGTALRRGGGNRVA